MLLTIFSASPLQRLAQHLCQTAPFVPGGIATTWRIQHVLQPSQLSTAIFGHPNVWIVERPQGWQAKLIRILRHLGLICEFPKAS